MSDPAPKPRDCRSLMRECVLRFLADLRGHGLAVKEIHVEAVSDSELEAYLSVMPRCEPEAAPVTGPVLSECEAAIVEVLTAHPILTGPQLAELTGYPYDSHLKTTLATLRRRGLIVNRAPGYALS